MNAHCFVNSKPLRDAKDFAEERKGFPLRSFAKIFASSAFDLLSAATQPVESYSGFVFY